MVKKSIIKFIIAIHCLISLCYSMYASSAQKLIPADHWVYNAAADIFMETGHSSIAMQYAPITVAELKIHLEEIDYESLSDYGKEQYNRIFKYFESDHMFLSSNAIAAGGEVNITPELYYKSNKHIPWSHSYYYKDRFIKLPVYFSVTDYLYIEGDFFFGKNYWTMQKPDNWQNFPIDFTKDGLFTAFEFDWPETGFLSAGFSIMGKATINFQIGRGKTHIGRTLTGSIIMSDSFETDAFSTLSIFSPNIRYTLGLMQVSAEKFFYTHRFDIRLGKKLTISAMEGAYVINSGFEIRFFNPLQLMHSHEYWANDYQNRGLNNCCAYLCLALDFVPIKNLRFYFQYAQNEITAPNEGGTTEPISIGFQLGAESTIPLKTKGAIHANIETIYTMPWLYVKHTPKSSLASFQQQNIPGDSPDVVNWIGSPFGPDSMAIALKAGYEIPGKWSASLTYMWVAQGINAFVNNIFYRNGRLLDPKQDGDPDTYYPPTLGNKYNGEGSWFVFHDTTQFTNRFIAEGTYIFNRHFSAAAKASYTFVFNSRYNQSGSPVKNNFQHGVEFSISGTYKVF